MKCGVFRVRFYYMLAWKMQKESLRNDFKSLPLIFLEVRRVDSIVLDVILMRVLSIPERYARVLVVLAQ